MRVLLLLLRDDAVNDTPFLSDYYLFFQQYNLPFSSSLSRTRTCRPCLDTLPSILIAVLLLSLLELWFLSPCLDSSRFV